MADVAYSALRTQLDIELRDADNFTFTVPEKDEALRAAVEDDPNCFAVALDDSNTIVSAQARYDTPFEETLEVGYDVLGDGYVTKVPRGAWEQVGAEILFDRDYIGLPAGKTLYIYGLEHLTHTSRIPSSMRSYIIANAVVRAVDLQMSSKVYRFSRTDATMADMQMLRANKAREADKLRPKLRNRRAVRF